MTKVKNVLVLCVNNSCRSIMAEALINALGKGQYHAKSAGSNPAGSIHPKTIETLRRHGIDPGHPRSKSWNEFAIEPFTILVSVCKEIENKVWPVFPGNPQRFYWRIPDPTKEPGTDAEINAAFDKSFLLLKEKVEQMIAGRE